ncbi:MAG: pseudouridine synthase [Rubricoccaceae bacterium]|nr:pseudouridine synthase [Rubricoccaceae bacterium]
MNKRAETQKSIRRRKIAKRRHAAKTKEVVADAPPEFPMRLNRFIARAGISSRREADELIAAGRVVVNDSTVTEMGTQVSESDRVVVDGRPISLKAPIYILLNKPKDTITTKDDDKDRQTVMDLLGLAPEEADSLFPVGRLDRDTTGLLLLTNDGDLAHRLMHPSYEIEKLYVVTTDRPVPQEKLDMLKSGVDLADGIARADYVGYVGENQKKVALQIHEGRNRQVRRMFEVLGLSVVHLERTRYAGLTLKNVRSGKWRRLRPSEINTLRRSVKLKPIVFAAN